MFGKIFIQLELQHLPIQQKYKKHDTNFKFCQQKLVCYLCQCQKFDQ